MIKIQMNKTGKIKDYWLGKTIIRSKRRFAYEDVQEIIEGSEGDHKEEILLLNSIAQTLRAARFKKGAFFFFKKAPSF